LTCLDQQKDILQDKLESQLKKICLASA